MARTGTNTSETNFFDQFNDESTFAELSNAVCIDMGMDETQARAFLESKFIVEEFPISYSNEQRRRRRTHVLRESGYRSVPDAPRPEVLENVDLDELIVCLHKLDGREFQGSEFFIEMGFDADFVRDNTEFYRSDFSSPLSTIYNKYGVPMRGVYAVLELDFVRELAKRIRVDLTTIPGRFGRRSQAREYAAACFRRLTELGIVVQVAPLTE